VEFDPRDLERFKTSDRWLLELLDYNYHNIDNSFKQAWSTLLWRKKIGVNGKKMLSYQAENRKGKISHQFIFFRKNLIKKFFLDISEDNVRMDYLIDSNLYFRGRDIDGKLMMVFKGILHTRGSKNMKDLQQCFLYWLERGFREIEYDQMTIVFDLMNTGLSNVDMEYQNYIINTLKHYYPNTLNYILVYDMPWIMNG
jgi:CRAL/TRIO domain